jgi:hypothetical protein
MVYEGLSKVVIRCVMGPTATHGLIAGYDFKFKLLFLPFELGSLLRPCSATMRAATRTLFVGLLLPCSLYTYSGACGVRCTGGFGMRSNILLPDGLVEWSLLIVIIGLERTTPLS